MENLTGIDHASVFINETILNPANSRKLFTGEEKQKNLQNIGQEIKDFNAVQTETLLKIILNGLSTDNRYWTQDAREAALEVLPIIDLQKVVPKDKIFDHYSQAIGNMLDLSIDQLDPYGQFDAVLRAGMVLASHIASSGYGKSEIDSLISELKDKAKLYSTIKTSSNFSEEDTKYLLDQINQLEAEIYSYGVEEGSETDKGDNREQLAEQVKALQDSGLTFTEIANQLGVSIQDVINTKESQDNPELSLMQIPGSNMPDLKVSSNPDSIASTIHEAKAESKDGYLTPDQQEELNRIQEKAKESVVQYLDQMQPGALFPLVAMATGIGKGRIIHLLIEEQMKRKPDSKILLIAGTKDVLVKQSHEKLEEYQRLGQVGSDEIDEYIEAENDDELVEETIEIEENPLEGQTSSKYTTGKIESLSTNVHIATIQTVHSRIKTNKLNPDGYDLVIVDEVHNIGTPLRKSAIDNFTKVVGFTATPNRHSGVLKTPEEYGFIIVESFPLPDAQNAGFLPPLLGIQINTKNLISEIPLNKNGEINYRKLEAILKQSPDLHPYISDRIERLIISPEGKTYKTIIVVNFVWEAQELAKLLNKAGFRVGVAVNQQAAKSIHTYDIPAIDSIERYHLAEDDPRGIQVLISPYVAAEGFDAPFTEALVWASPTNSGLRYTQFTGRLTRRSPNKPFGLVIDCLYQTSQHTWSYNMARWFREHVIKLDNGTLYLGPENQMGLIKELASVQAIEQELTQEDRISLSSLQEDSLEDIKETDASITNLWLRSVFIGDSEKKLIPLAYQIAHELEENQDTMRLVQQRKNYKHIVTVVTDKDLFIRMMVEKGVKLKEKDILDLQKTDAAITQAWLQATFIGREHEIKSLANQVIQELRENEDTKGLIIQRRNNTRLITVVTDSELFKTMMLEKGAKLREDNILDIQETDAPITHTWLLQTFVGAYPSIKQRASQTIEELSENENTRGLITKRRNKTHNITVVTDKDLFIQKMIENGARLKPQEITEIQDGDIVINTHTLNDTFLNGYSLTKLANSVLSEMKSTNPSWVLQARRGKHILPLLRSQEARDFFFQKMQERGADLRNKEIEKSNLLILQLLKQT